METGDWSVHKCRQKRGAQDEGSPLLRRQRRGWGGVGGVMPREAGMARVSSLGRGAQAHFKPGM